MTQISHTVSKVARKIEWHSFLMGGLMLIFGIVMAFNFNSEVKQYSIIIGLIGILKGFLNFNYYSTNIRFVPKEKWHSFYLVSGIVSIILGLFIIFNFSATNNLLCIVCGFWFIWDYIPQIMLNELEFSHMPRALLTFRIMEGICILCGILLMFQSLIPFNHSIIFAIIYYLLSGSILL